MINSTLSVRNATVWPPQIGDARVAYSVLGALGASVVAIVVLCCLYHVKQACLRAREDGYFWGYNDLRTYTRFLANRVRPSAPDAPAIRVLQERRIASQELEITEYV